MSDTYAVFSTTDASEILLEVEGSEIGRQAVARLYLSPDASFKVQSLPFAAG